MPKICYTPKRFSSDRLQVIDTANQILDDYHAQGYDLTLRQLYYQFVSRGLIPNRDAEYKKLGDTINDGRLAGLIDWERIEDRTRNLRALSHWNSPQEIIETCAGQFRVNLWETQHNYVEVWVEKDALVGVLQVACEPLDVPYFSCRGYVSQSEMWVAGMRILAQLRLGKDATVLHLGDHDPSGVDMTRDINDRLNLFIRHHLRVPHDFKVDRIALTMEQIQGYNPPPNPAKITDSRSASYIDKYGDESWELDALEPAILAHLIQERAGVLRDERAWEEAWGRQDDGRRRLEAVSGRWDEVLELVGAGYGSGNHGSAREDLDGEKGPGR
jgi:hypothetical protein